MYLVHNGYYCIILLRTLKGCVQAVDKKKPQHEGSRRGEQNGYACFGRKKYEHCRRPDEDKQEECA